VTRIATILPACVLLACSSAPPPAGSAEPAAAKSAPRTASSASAPASSVSVPPTATGARGVEPQAKDLTGEAAERAAAVHRAVVRALADDPGRCPTLAQLRAEQGLEAEQGSDPWGHDLRIECHGDGALVRSVGADGEEGSADDVTVPASR